jgi:hypothetical protein
VAISERTEIVAVGTTTSFLQWTPVFAGALVAAAVSVVLIAFGTTIGLASVSSSPTWRDTSPALTMVSGLYLLLTALVSFGVGGTWRGGFGNAGILLCTAPWSSFGTALTEL